MAIAIIIIGGTASVMTGYASGQDRALPLQEGQTTLREIVRKKLHHGQGRYLSPWSQTMHGRFFELIKWKVASPNGFKNYYQDEKARPVSIDWSPVLMHKGLSVTFITHSTILIRDKGTNILVDPVLSGLAWPIKNFTPVIEGPSTMPAPDYILITHGHYDHLDLPTVSRFASGPLFITPLGYEDILREAGVGRIRELDWFDSYSDRAREIILLPCHHWTMRSPLNGPNTALWGSYVIKTASGPVIYISGDTAYFPGFREIGQEFPIDLAIFNLGAYEPRWFMKKAHMNPEEAVRAFRELGAKRLMIVHWGIFRLGDAPVHFPPVQIRQEMEKENLGDRLEDTRHGETLFFDNDPAAPRGPLPGI
jgi:L-ascorbate metabolism protein UlaG (beta-lactamase superfamily)